MHIVPACFHPRAKLRSIFERSYLELFLSASLALLSLLLLLGGLALAAVSVRGLLEHKARCAHQPQGFPGCGMDGKKVPWIYPAFISAGILVALTTLLGILSASRFGNRGLLTCYGNLQFMILLLQVGLFIAVLLDDKWMRKLPKDQSEEIDLIKKKLAAHARAVRLLAGGGLALNALIFLSAAALGSIRTRIVETARAAALARDFGDIEQPLLGGPSRRSRLTAAAAEDEDEFYSADEGDGTWRSSAASSVANVPVGASLALAGAGDRFLERMRGKYPGISTDELLYPTGERESLAGAAQQESTYSMLSADVVRPPPGVEPSREEGGFGKGGLCVIV